MIIHFLAVISPGPDFIIVTSQSINYGRLNAIKTSIGISFGILIHIILSIFGVNYIFVNNTIFYDLVKYICFIYLFYFSLSLIFSKKKHNNILHNNNKSIYKNPFLIGFLTNLLNPKALVFFISIFSIFVNQLTPFYIRVIYGMWMVFATCFWFCIISIFFTLDFSKNFLNKYSIIISKIMGIILLIISIKVIF